METITMKINGMSCGHCVGAVSRALKTVPGVEDADVKIGSATVRFDPAKVSVEQLTHSVDDAGYEASVAA